MPTTFRTGVPCTDTPLVVEGFGLATYAKMYESDVVDIVVGGRTLAIPAATAWRPAAG